MDMQDFDDLTRTLATRKNRRGVLRVLGGAFAAAVALRTGKAAAKPDKLAICHATGSADNPWVVIEIAGPAWEAHRAHGDRPFIDCCSDADCGSGACIDGACSASCSPTFTVDDCDGVTCGAFSDGCDGTVTCGCAGDYDTCGGGGEDGQCGCSGMTYEQACGDACGGTVTDGCGTVHTCECDVVCDGVPSVAYVANTTSNGFTTNGSGWLIPLDEGGHQLRQECFTGPNSFDEAAQCPVVTLCGLTYWAYTYWDNRNSFAIVGYDQTGTIVDRWEAPGGRYLWQITLDETNELAIFWGQSNITSTATWSELAAPL